MIHSMTAFARAEKHGEQKAVSVEIRTVNHRFCEISVRIPRPWISLEEKIKNSVRQHVARGRVEVTIDIQDQEGSSRSFEADIPLAKAYYKALSHLKESLGMSAPIPIENVARINGVISASSTEPDLDSDWLIVEEAMSEALTALCAMRETEGAALFEDFQKRLSMLEDFLDQIKTAAKDQPRIHLERLREKISALLDGLVEVDEARLAQEAAFLADKSDITEEIVRALSHISQFREILDQNDPPGRSLNFLAQELHREFSTMGSKSSDADLSHTVVAAKAEVEKIREQVQNVE